jgi:uncharacterized membrane protein YagU involved in acid resistance
MKWGDWLLWGFVATVVLTTILASSQGLGLTRMNIPYLLGTIFTPSRDRAKLIGTVVHFLNGWIFTLLYFAVFHSMAMATWWLGAIMGLVHGTFVLTVMMPALSVFHPHMANEQHGPDSARQLEPPGFLALHYGVRTPVSVLLAHAIFGAILGMFCALDASAWMQFHQLTK